MQFSIMPSLMFDVSTQKLLRVSCYHQVEEPEGDAQQDEPDAAAEGGEQGHDEEMAEAAEAAEGPAADSAEEKAPQQEEETGKDETATEQLAETEAAPAEEGKAPQVDEAAVDATAIAGEDKAVAPGGAEDNPDAYQAAEQQTGQGRLGCRCCGDCRHYAF